MPVEKPQSTPQQVLILTTQSPLQVTRAVIRYLGSCLITLRELDLATLSTDALASVISEVRAHSGPVFTDYCVQAVALHASTLDHDADVVAMTTRHPMHVPMPALNLDTGMTNFG